MRSAQTNDITAAEVLVPTQRLWSRPPTPHQPEDMAPSNDLTATNGLPQASVPVPGGDRPNRFIRPDSQQPLPRAPADLRMMIAGLAGGVRPGQGPTSPVVTARPATIARAATAARRTPSPGRTMAPSRWITPPSRSSWTGISSTPTAIRTGRERRAVRPPPKSVDSLTLVGTMSYEKGTFAFFDGTSSDYKKALKLTDSIAGYKVTNITPNGVKLASGTNELDLSVGAQLRREEDGPWLLAGQSASYAAAPASTSTNGAAATTATGSDATSGGAESDIIKRLMQKREKE